MKAITVKMMDGLHSLPPAFCSTRFSVRLRWQSGLLALAVTVLASGELAADPRVYISPKPVHEVIPSFIDQLSGIQFKVVRNFNEASDGKLGFILILMPGQRYCDISFIENPGKGTVLKITAQDRADENLFSRIALRLGMSEPDVHPVQDSGPSWPEPGR